MKSEVLKIGLQIMVVAVVKQSWKYSEITVFKKCSLLVHIHEMKESEVLKISCGYTACFCPNGSV